MIDPWSVVAFLAVAIAITGGIKISVGDINIGNASHKKDDT